MVHSRSVKLKVLIQNIARCRRRSFRNDVPAATRHLDALQPLCSIPRSNFSMTNQLTVQSKRSTAVQTHKRCAPASKALINTHQLKKHVLLHQSQPTAADINMRIIVNCTGGSSHSMVTTFSLVVSFWIFCIHAAAHTRPVLLLTDAAGAHDSAGCQRVHRRARRYG